MAGMPIYKAPVMECPNTLNAIKYILVRIDFYREGLEMWGLFSFFAGDNECDVPAFLAH
jgi:hypothetical protein